MRSGVFLGTSPQAGITFPLVNSPAVCQYVDMVCVYCGSPTKITNSRPQKRLHQTWRRHACSNCGAIFTTNEIVDLSTSLAVRSKTGHLQPFSRDRLFISVYRAVGHRERAVDDASALTATIAAKLVHSTSVAAISPADIINTTLQTLKQFDTAATVQYQAYHKP